MKKGLLITFEGIDGSGKTTQITKINEYLKSLGYKTIFTREPGGTLISEEIRKIILNNDFRQMSSTTELLLYCAARAQLIQELILPSISEGKIILCDRFIDSTIVYQGYGRGIDIKALNYLNELVLNGVKPNKTFLISITPEESRRRLKRVLCKDRIENEEDDFYSKLYQGYNELHQTYPDRIIKINGDMEINEIYLVIKNEIDKILRSC